MYINMCVFDSMKVIYIYNIYIYTYIYNYINMCV